MFLDANIFIYAYQSNDPRGKACLSLLSRIIKGKQKASTSWLVFDEMLFYFQKTGRHEKGKLSWENATSMPNLFILPLDQKAGMQVMKFVSAGLDATDAFHAAVMAANGVETICSYDKAFDKIKGIKRQEPK